VEICHVTVYVILASYLTVRVCFHRSELCVVISVIISDICLLEGISVFDCGIYALFSGFFYLNIGHCHLNGAYMPGPGDQRTIFHHFSVSPVSPPGSFSGMIF